MTEQKLLPCPFCGSTNLEVYETDDVAFVRCLGCYAEGPQVVISAKEFAVHLWNVRVPKDNGGKRDD